MVIPLYTLYYILKFNDMSAIEKLLRDINQAFAMVDTEFIVKHVTNDIKWTIVGDTVIKGKDAFIKSLEEMDGPGDMTLEVNNILINGNSAAVDGEIIAFPDTGKKKKYAFCDIYKISDEKTPRIKEMISYLIDITKIKNQKF